MGTLCLPNLVSGDSLVIACINIRHTPFPVERCVAHSVLYTTSLAGEEKMV